MKQPLSNEERIAKARKKFSFKVARFLNYVLFLRPKFIFQVPKNVMNELGKNKQDNA